MNGGKGIYVGGTLVSILISLALYATGRRESAIFVGLWAPTILNLGQSLLDEDYGHERAGASTSFGPSCPQFTEARRRQEFSAVCIQHSPGPMLAARTCCTVRRLLVGRTGGRRVTPPPAGNNYGATAQNRPEGG